MTDIFRIADLNFGQSDRDCWYELTHAGKKFEIQRVSASYSMAYMRELVVTYRNEVDAFAISGFPPISRIGNRSYIHRQYLELLEHPTSIPMCDGRRVRDLAIISSVAGMIKDQTFNPKGGVFFPVAMLHLELIEYLAKEYADHLRFGDAYSITGAPLVTRPGKFVDAVMPVAVYLATLRGLAAQAPMPRNPLSRVARQALLAQMRDCQTVVCDVGILNLFGKDLDFIRDRDVLLTTLHPSAMGRIQSFNPRSVRSLMPDALALHPYINYSVADTVLRLAHGRTSALSTEDWRSLLKISPENLPESSPFGSNLKPSIQYKLTERFNRTRQAIRPTEKPDFAFVVHALSNDDLFKIPGARYLKQLSPEFRDGIEKTVARLPGFTYGHLKNCVSAKTNRSVNGIIYALPATPKQMLSQDPDITYRKIETLCEHAASLGAKIMGLGAYTKVLGDAGETINQNSPIPVTTGNSLSASATLWALAHVARKLEILPSHPDGKRTDGLATIIGATGAIGRVSAKLLASAFTRICLVAPRLARLEELALEIKQIAPECEIYISTDANSVAPISDVLVTATSAFDQKIVDVERLKPGCVVCDCSRPLDFTLEDAMKRPDVLIIESGEVILPGGAEITCDLGLPGNVVYACLGETAVLAMEGLYEPFTLGRDIDWYKVKRIYKMAIEHGVELAAIRGHAGIITDREIKLARELALTRRAEQGTIQMDPLGSPSGLTIQNLSALGVALRP